ncbi:MAG: hypothetical protein HOW97_32975, partial [Catenulispora sp.]|nr:hypothetical protein [Catenulispora sp.]
MRRRGHHRRGTLVAAGVTAGVLVAAFVGVTAHADPGNAGSGNAGSGNAGSGPVIPGQDAIDHARAAVRDREAAAGRIQSALTAADNALHALEASAGLAAESYDAAVAQAAAATRAAADAQTKATAALDTQHRAEGRLGAFAAAMYRQGPDMARIVALLHAGTLHDFATREQALANYDAAGALAVKDARQATRDATAARQQAERAAQDQQAAEGRARAARDRARALAVAEQAQVAGIKARQDALLGQLAAAQGVEVGLERQRQAGLA